MPDNNKIFYPKSGITKGQVVEYYKKIAPYLLPHVHNRLIVMHRFPDGITGTNFYQKQIPNYFPDWIGRMTIELKKGEKQTVVMINDERSLVYLANQAVLVLHAWLSSAPKVNMPTKIVFDLDPSVSGLEKIKETTLRIKAVLENLGLVPFIMTTGSRGYHIVTPIVAEHSFEKVHDFTKHICAQLTKKYSDLTIEMDKTKRGTRIFLDYLRNSYGQTSVAPYSLRAKPGAPVATPIDWSELSKTDPQTYTMKNIFRRLAQKEDPWKHFLKNAKRIPL